MPLRRRCPRLLAALLSLCAFAVVQAASLEKVEWQTGTDRGAESLLLQFASTEVPDVQVEVQAWGLDVWLPGVAVEGVRAEAIRIVNEQGGARLRVERPGLELRSVRLEGRTVRLSVHGPAMAPPPGVSAYRVGVSDVVSVLVYGNPDLSGDFAVAPDGTIQMPLVGSVPAAGMTDSQISRQLHDLLERDFLVDPQVSVSVKAYQSQWAYVAGAVARAVRIPLGPTMTLKDVLSEAGVALAPGQELVLTRTGGNGETRVLDAAAVEAGDAPVPRDGDVLTVQEPQYVFIQGEVRRPGRYLLTEEMTILQAIALAEGFTDWADKRGIRVLRTVGEDTLEERVNFKKVEERRAPDLPLAAGDVILVKRKLL